MYKQSIDDELTSVMDLAYFDGDFWPNVIEEKINTEVFGEVRKYKI